MAAAKIKDTLSRTQSTSS